jgi:diguanylate cyclase (GGDEF)-like protein/PAS domain S-box-containing protein
LSSSDTPPRPATASAEEAIRPSELFDALPAMVWRADAQGACVYVNRAYERFTGLTLAQVAGSLWLEAVHPEDRDTVEAWWKQAFVERRPFSAQYRLRRADGTFAWIHHAAEPVALAGLAGGYLGTCDDITEQRAAELRALAREAQVRMLADNVPALIAYYDAVTLRCLFANKSYARMWGWDERSVIGRGLAEVIGEQGYAAIEPYVKRAQAGEAVTYERVARAPDGTERIVEASLLPQRDAEGRVATCVVMIHDITRHRAAEQAARDSEERLRKFADASHAGIVFHEGGVITDCNEAIVKLTGYSHEQLVGSPILDYVAPERRPEAEENVRRAYERAYESEIVARDGSRIPVELEGRTMPYKGKVYRLSVVRDIRRRKANQARIDFLAHHDLLTGLPNRALLHDRLEFILTAARRRGTQAAVLFIDLDNFKTVNDSLGHVAGDTLLRIIAARIPAVLRREDVVSRHGGDEFLVVLPEIEGENGPVPVAEKLLAAIAEPMVLEGQSISVSPSIGISVFPRDGEDADALIKNADAAMYLAKERGRSNYQFFNHRLAEAAYRALTLEARLREAIREQAFELYYQPQVRVDSGELVGVEALIRWPHAGGWMEPNEFIPVAEQRGLIRTLGAWVLRRACEQARAWQRAGLAIVPVAVNLSAVQFRQKNLPGEVERVLAETGLEPRYLAFELTESMLMQDTAEIARTLQGLRSLGVQLAIDDFGTGHSSLMHLKSFAIDKLKIDRTFVRDIPADPDDVAITAAIIDLARNMGITSIAEGVERQDQLEFLRSRGCEEAQGYLFAPAMDAAAMARWLQARPRMAPVTGAPIE